MKEKFCIKPKRKRHDFSFAKFFHPEKSPRTIWSINPLTHEPECVRQAKHEKYRGRIIWNSMRKGTYFRKSLAS